MSGFDFAITPVSDTDGVVRCADPFCLARMSEGSLQVSNVERPGAEQWRLISEDDRRHLDLEWPGLLDALREALR